MTLAHGTVACMYPMGCFDWLESLPLSVRGTCTSPKISLLAAFQFWNVFLRPKQECALGD